MTKLCTCYMLNVLFYVQSDQFDEAKQRINIPCIIQVLFYHKCSFSWNHYRTINQTLINLHSIYRLYIKWYPNHDVQRCSQNFVSSEKLQIRYIETFQRNIEVDFEHILDLYNSLERKTEIILYTICRNNDIIIIEKRTNYDKCSKICEEKYSIPCNTYKCRSLLFNAGELVCIVKSNMQH